MDNGLLNRRAAYLVVAGPLAIKVIDMLIGSYGMDGDDQQRNRHDNEPPDNGLPHLPLPRKHEPDSQSILMTAFHPLRSLRLGGILLL